MIVMCCPGAASSLLRLVLAGLFIGYGGFSLAPGVLAQEPSDSIQAWTEALESGALDQRIEAVSGLRELPAASLPPATRVALVEELSRVNELLIEGRAIPGTEELRGSEALGGYLIYLSGLVFQLASDEAGRALLGSIGVSDEISRRVAQLGDETIRMLDRFLDRDFEVASALRTMGHAWAWADSSGAALSSESRRVIVDRILESLAGEDFAGLIGSGSALRAMRDPAFLPLVEQQVSRQRARGEPIVARTLEVDVLPTLGEVASQTTVIELGMGTRRVIEVRCRGSTQGPRRGFCESTLNRMDTAIRHLEGGRRGPARNVLESLASSADRALEQETISAAEHALIAGGARQVLERL